MASVKIKRGFYGPSHDSYAYTEITFYPTNKRRKPVIFHVGLGVKLTHGKRVWRESVFNPELFLKKKFEKITGITPEYALSVPDRLHERRMRRKTKKEQVQIEECMAIDDAMLRNAY